MLQNVALEICQPATFNKNSTLTKSTKDTLEGEKKITKRERFFVTNMFNLQIYSYC